MIEIKPIVSNHADILYHLIETNRTYLQQNFPVTVEQVKSIERARIFVKEKIKERNHKLGYYFITFYNHHPCGIINIKNIDWRTPKGELAYFVDEKMQGKKIATQSVKEIIRYAFYNLKLLKLYACIDPQNSGSKYVVLKNGFTLEGLLKNNFRNGFNEIRNSEYYGLINNLQ